MRAFAVPLLMTAQFLFGLGLTGYNIAAVSLRQASAPDRLQGRVNASVRFLVQGLTPLGALAGGALGLRLGLRPTLVLAAAGELLAALWLLASPLRAGSPSPPRPEGTRLSQWWERGSPHRTGCNSLKDLDRGRNAACLSSWPTAREGSANSQWSPPLA